jgi:hypothetical protein
MDVISRYSENPSKETDFTSPSTEPNITLKYGIIAPEEPPPMNADDDYATPLYGIVPAEEEPPARPSLSERLESLFDRIQSSLEDIFSSISSLFKNLSRG